MTANEIYIHVPQQLSNGILLKSWLSTAQLFTFSDSRCQFFSVFLKKKKSTTQFANTNNQLCNKQPKG